MRYLSVLGNFEDKAPDFWPKNAQRERGTAAGGGEQKESIFKVGRFSEQENFFYAKLKLRTSCKQCFTRYFDICSWQH